MGSPKNNRWSTSADCCIVCGTTKHKAATRDGLCKACWQRRRDEKKKLEKKYISKEELGKRISFGRLKSIITKEELYRLYIIEKLGSAQIAAMYNTNKSAIVKRLHLFEIPIRSNREAQKLAQNKPETVAVKREKALRNHRDPEYNRKFMKAMASKRNGMESAEAREKVRQANKGRVKTKTERERLSKSLKRWAKENPDKMKKVHRAHLEMMANTPKKFTDIEKIMATILDELGIGYVQQYVIKKDFIVDFYLPNDKIVIEADGDYWHKKAKQAKKDAAKDKYLIAIGLIVVRFWGSDIKGNPEMVKQKIKEVIKNAKQPQCKT